MRRTPRAQGKQTGSTSPSRAPPWRQPKNGAAGSQGRLCLEKGSDSREGRKAQKNPPIPSRPSPQSNRRHLKRPPLRGARPRQPISARAEVNSARLPARRGAAPAEGAVGGRRGARHGRAGRGAAAAEPPPLRFSAASPPPPRDSSARLPHSVRLRHPPSRSPPPSASLPRSSSPPAPSGRLLPPYHVSSPHIEKVPVHHGAVAAPLLGHAELLRGVCRHLRRRRRRRKQLACLSVRVPPPPPPGEAAALRRALPSGGREARRVQSVGRRPPLSPAATAPGGVARRAGVEVGAVPSGRSRGGPGAVWGGERRGPRGGRVDGPDSICPCAAPGRGPVSGGTGCCPGPEHSLCPLRQAERCGVRFKV